MFESMQGKVDKTEVSCGLSWNSVFKYLPLMIFLSEHVFKVLIFAYIYRKLIYLIQAVSPKHSSYDIHITERNQHHGDTDRRKEKAY